MDVEKRILEELIGRYERSRLFREGVSSQRILLHVSKCEWLQRCMENADENREFLETIDQLQKEGLLDFSWVRYETGNLVDKIWLITEEKALKESYRRAGRIPKAGTLEELQNQVSEIRQAAEQRDPGDTCGIAAFLEEMQSILEEKRKIPRFFFQAGETPSQQKSITEKNGRLLRFLLEICGSADEQMERVISSRLYGDSKYFEHELRAKVISILRYISAKQGRETENDEMLLAEYGIVKWPEILEFCGKICLILDDGSRIDCSACRYGAYLNSETLRHIREIEAAPELFMPGARVLTIENKANYTWYLASEKKENELVLYHGGFLSPVRKRWFEILKESLRKRETAPAFLHWSDIDLGGFRIFHMLCTVFDKAVPFRMDRETLMKYADRCIPIEKEAYLKELGTLLCDEEYRVFHETIAYMLEHRVRLEQEVLIW
ncbi:MAG: hypothetical protein IIY55_11550 [Blautia sp.]|nr:hypothetical protein [Blautia sp.]